MGDVPDDHPRAQSLRMRARIEEHRATGLVAETGPIAHGRGEAFDYLIGERTPDPVFEDIETAAAILLEAERPVISVNGNTAVLVAEEIIALSSSIPAALEVNVFYGRTQSREAQIADFLRSKGALAVLGVDPQAKVPHLTSARGMVDREGIYAADVVLVPLEDGDRTQALIKWGKKVISIDLNPLSRTALDSTLNLCDNVVRAVPLLEKAVRELRGDEDRLRRLSKNVNNRRSTGRVLEFISTRLNSLAHDMTQTNESPM